jgi:hypothetical protein
MTGSRTLIDRMRESRSWLAAAYVLATVLAHCAHDHDSSERASAPRCEAGCAYPLTHLSGHASPDLSRAAPDCLACKYRADHHAWLILGPSSLHPTVEIALVAIAPSVAPESVLRPTCRAPPRV